MRRASGPGYDNARANFGFPSIKTWSIDIEIQPGVDRAAVDAIAQTVPAAYSITVASAPFPIPVAAVGHDPLALLPMPVTPMASPRGNSQNPSPAAKPSATMPARRSRAALRKGFPVHVTSIESGSLVSVAVLKGKAVVARKTTTAPQTSSPAGAATSLRVPVPRTAVKVHGTTVFTVRVTMFDTAGASITSSSRVRVS